MNRGGSITVKGQAWSTGCNDTPMNANPGALEGPMTGIVLEIVQDGQRTVLANGNATGDYTVTRREQVPATLQPGPATLAAGSGSAPVVLTISDAPPASQARGAAVRFGPTGRALAATATPASREVDDTFHAFWLIVGVVVVVVIIGALAAAKTTITPKMRRGTWRDRQKQTRHAV